MPVASMAICRGRTVPWAYLLALVAIFSPDGARALSFESGSVQLRVMAQSVPVRAGPGGLYPSMGTVGQGQVFDALDRSSDGAWYRIRLARGISGWVLSELVWPFVVVEEGTLLDSAGFMGGRSQGQIEDRRFSLTIEGGVRDLDGLFSLRVGFLPTRHYLLELAAAQSIGGLGHLTTLTAELAVLIAPRRPVIPFLSAGGGGTQSQPHSDSRLFSRNTYPTLSAGGGLLVGLPAGLIARLDVRQTLVFSPNEAWSMLSISGGLMVTF